MTSSDPIPPFCITASGHRSVGAESIGVAISGDGARVALLPREAVRWAQEISAPPHACHVPGSAAGLFLGRDSEIARVRQLLSGGEAAITQPQAIHGLGGVGKSTLALQYAHRFREEYTLVWWIVAESPEQINASLAALAMRLCPHWAGAAAQDERTAWALTWLQWHPGWLLIFDNVENPDDLRSYLGSLTGGHCLITSRKSTGWHAIAPTVPLGVLTVDAAADVLCALAFDHRPPTREQRHQAVALAVELGCLPLALEQAGAYLRQTGVDLETYRLELGSMLTKKADGTEHTIARVWDRTLNAITARDPFAVELLHSLAWLAPDGIPRTLLSPLATDRVALDEALGLLHAYNMVVLSGPEIGVHRLVQAVLRMSQYRSGDAPPGRAMAEHVLQTAITPRGDEEPPAVDRWRHLIPHVIALSATSPPGPHIDAAVSAYRTVSRYLMENGQEVRAIPLHQAVLAQHEYILGPGDPETLGSRDLLASSYYWAGDPQKAIPLYAENLIHRKHAMGEMHPDTLVNAMRLAHAYRMARDPERAVSLYEEILPKSVEVLGEDHPDTLKISLGLAGAYKWSNALDRAIPLFESTVKKYEKTLGDTHIDTLFSRDHLAGAYSIAENFEKAIPLFERTRAQCEETLGRAHRLTLRLGNNLGVAYQKSGEIGRAVDLFERILAESERSFGDTHPDTVGSRDFLADAYRAAGDLERAIALYETVLMQREQFLGHEHPETRNSRDNLARALREAQAAPQTRTSPPAEQPPPATHQ